MFLSHTQLVEQRGAYEQLGGAVFREASFGFMPAFMDLNTSEVHLSSYDDGMPSVVHILDGLPGYWVAEWGRDGRAVSLKPGVIAGYMRSGVFYTLNEIMNDLKDA
ncbi:MAG: hypothetical protein OEY43_03280 [Gammaproteobacteria bacterium]|nr:hypothetical protein [Gammaproteobacteria bacterium]